MTQFDLIALLLGMCLTSIDVVIFILVINGIIKYIKQYKTRQLSLWK